MATAAHVLIVEARYYDEIADEMVKGAIAALDRAEATYDRLAVPGAFEIPAAIRMVIVGNDLSTSERRYDAFVALGCVIRGETTHYDYVCGESARGLMDLSVRHAIALGYGILTCENREQAWTRARTDGGNKGGNAVAAALAMLEIRRRFGLERS
jgi:6,7-dimethyl-8-ribityllumazine synthase